MNSRTLLLIPKIKIHNANALSSPYTIGFPAMTAWLGAVHALQRQLNAIDDYDEVRLSRMAVISHDFNLQTYKGNSDYVYSIIGTGNPLDKNGDRPSFIEEARCHLTVSLTIECEELGLIDENEFLEQVTKTLISMKLAGGDVLSMQDPQLIPVEDENSLKILTRKVMPGFCLIERRDLMQQAMQEGQDAIDALLDYLSVHHHSNQDDAGHVTWTSSRKTKGWIVPIATGFHGLNAPGLTENQRDPDTPHRFAESIVTLGEFVMPYRISNLDNMLWQYHADLKNSLYLCQQTQPITQ
ncbi:type I-F CRISPR-associated protein Csy2 [Methylomarinum sp. Ch1-1]|uniref:Type I-F CRISPR-associated protein Csy2 n=1 Tax=Methylomarinum roseum TaxID=3067653 RepID=A0AAU7NZN8_9GAMM|nr:type I-F CRISPR-associated protein Csy2 [Methylomarinum sp. Ch1-1]MDP4521392.1 type I-F CRISPR-associated protein Csy2 [Methylomarinum sp. Ch1-1]